MTVGLAQIRLRYLNLILIFESYFKKGGCQHRHQSTKRKVEQNACAIPLVHWRVKHAIFQLNVLRV